MNIHQRFIDKIATLTVQSCTSYILFLCGDTADTLCELYVWTYASHQQTGQS